MADKGGDSAFSYIKPDGTLGSWTNPYTLPPDIAGSSNKTSDATAPRTTLDPFFAYNAFAPYSYANKKSLSDSIDLNKKYLEWMNSPMFVQARMRKLQNQIQAYAISGKASKKDKFWHGYNSASHWWGFPILDTLVRPIYALFKGLNYTRTSHGEFSTTLGGEYLALEDQLNSTKPKAAPARPMVNIPIANLGGQAINYTIPRDLTPEDFQKDPNLRLLLGFPAEPARARAPQGPLTPDMINQVLSNPQAVNQLLSAMAAARGAP